MGIIMGGVIGFLGMRLENSLELPKWLGLAITLATSVAVGALVAVLILRLERRGDKSHGDDSDSKTS